MQYKSKIDEVMIERIKRADSKRSQKKQSYKLSELKAAPSSNRDYNDWIKAYVTIHEGSESPLIYHYWTAISTVAAALSRKCWVMAGDLAIYPNFYIVYVAPPGVAQKSSAMGGGLRLLKDLDEVVIGHSTTSWQAIVETMQDNPKTAEITNRFGERENIAYHPLFTNISELGTFFTTHDIDKINFLVDMWDNSSTYSRNTMHTGVIELQNPFLSFIAGTTPGWLLEPNNKFITTGGLASRLIFVFQNKKGSVETYPTFVGGGSALQSLQLDLERISQLTGEFVLSYEARNHLDLFYRMSNLLREEGDKGEHIESFLSRIHAHAFKLAMVSSAARGDDMEISYEDAVFAEHFAMEAYENINPIQNLLMTSEGAQLRDRAIRVLLTSPIEEMERSYFLSLLEDIMSYDQAIAAILAAERSGQIERRQVSAKIFYRALKWKKPTSILMP